MSGAPELRLAPAIRRAAAAPSPEGKPGRSAEKSALPFAALLARHGNGTGGGAQSPGDARPLGRSLKLDLHQRDPAGPTALPRAEGDIFPTEDVPSEHARLDPVPQDQNLVQQVAGRIAASLDSAAATAAADDAASEAQAGANGNRRERMLPVGSAVAAAAARKVGGPGAAPSVASAELVVTRRETHLGSTSLAAADALARSASDAPVVGREPDAHPDALTGRAGNGGASDAAAMRQGRVDHLIASARAAADRGAAPAKAVEAVAGAALRSAEPAALAEMASPESLRGMPTEPVGFGLSGASDGRPSAAAGAPAAPPNAGPAALPAGSVPVKVLHIELHPAELGMLEVRMRLTDGGLEVHIAASTQEALAALKSDQDTLASIIRGTGHALEAVTVSLSERSGNQSGQSSQDGWQPPSGARPEAQSGSAREQGGRFDDRAASRPENGPAFEQVSDDQSRQSVGVRPRGGLYL